MRTRIPFQIGGVALSRFFRNSGHLIRPALVLLAGVVVFLIIRAAVVPKDFGKYGHYRAGALDMIAALPDLLCRPKPMRPLPRGRSQSA